MNRKTIAAVSVAAIGAGSFIAGFFANSLLVDRHCSGCRNRETTVVEEECDIIVEEETEEEDCPKEGVDEDLDTYRHISKQYAADHDGDSEFVITPGIHIIDVNEYLSNPTEFDQTTLVWYEDDRMMVDNRDEGLPVNEWTDMLGYNIEDRFGTMSDDPDVVYIRNYDLEMEYEVIREHSSFAKSVMGVKDGDDDYADARKYFGLDEKKE